MGLDRALASMQPNGVDDPDAVSACLDTYAHSEHADSMFTVL